VGNPHRFARCGCGALPGGALAGECLNVALQTENAMNAFVEAGEAWSGCFDDINCDIDSIDPELQAAWLDASGDLDKAEQALNRIGSPDVRQPRG
jgi:hypothetical protein